MATIREVYDALREAGFSDAEARTMTAVAIAESNLREDATAVSSVEYSVGVFQINLRAHPWVTEQCARDVRCAARAARRIYLSQGIRAWSAYGTARFAAARAEVERALSGSGQGEDSESGPLGLSRATLEKALANVTFFVVGLILVVGSLLALATKTDAGRAVKEYAEKVAQAAVSVGTRVV